jgi:hypothetical protein
MPIAECILQRSIENVDANLDEGLNRMSVPPHLLLLVHPFGDNLVHRGFGESGRYPRSATVALTVVWYGIRIQFQVSDRFQQAIP